VTSYNAKPRLKTKPNFAIYTCATEVVLFDCGIAQLNLFMGGSGGNDRWFGERTDDSIGGNPKAASVLFRELVKELSQ